MNSPPPMKGFDIDEVMAWWVVCKECSDSELVYGSMADVDAIAWAGEHARTHRP